MKEILNFNLNPVCKGDIEAIQREDGFLLKVGPAGGSITFTGEKGKVGGADWSLDKYIVIPLRYDLYHSYYFRYFFHGADGTWAESDFATLPFMDVEVPFPLTFLNLETTFMDLTPGRLKNMQHGTPQNPEDIVAIELVIPESLESGEIIYRYPYLSDKEPEQNWDVKPQVDRLGQWTMKDWDEKFANEEDMVKYLKEQRELELPPLYDNISKYGGNLDEKREATAWFRIHKEDGVYWLCDPEGCLMYSQGVDFVGARGFDCTIKNIEMLFEEFPPKNNGYEVCWGKNKLPDGTFSERVSYRSANLIRAFGEDWQKAWAEITEKRLRAYGFNTVANWSDKDFSVSSKIPFVMTGEFPTTENKIFRTLPDVFSKEYKDSAKESAKWLLEYKDNKYMIGYFMRNEPDWAFGDYNLAGIMLEKETEFASKDIFIAEMIRKYFTIDKFNEAWNLNLESFQDLKKPIEKPWELSESALEDTHNFTRRIIREYIRVPAAAYKAVDPNHLNLGLRWGWLQNEDLVEGCEYCDVFSINCYKEAPEKDLYDRIHALTNLPVLIGEFQVGALDVGYMSNGMFGVPTQSERGVFYKYYMEKAASYPYLIGAHYFAWNDHPPLGCSNGENLNIGVVDDCNQAHEGFVEGIKDTHRTLFDVHKGTIPHTEVRSNLVPKEGF